MMHSGVTVCSWNSPALSAGNTGFYVYRSVFAKQSETRSTTAFGNWCRNVCILYKTHVHDTSDFTKRIQWHMGKHITKRRSCWSLENAVVCMCQGKRTSLWTPAWPKPALFTANTLHNRLFSEPPKPTEENMFVLCHFWRSYLKVNKISKSEGTRKVK